MTDSAGCPFCARLADLSGPAGADVVWQARQGVAFLGPWQFYHGYCVFVSRRHATELSQLGDEERRTFLDEMCRLARAIEECFGPHKLNYELLGNQVPHLHWHLFPRHRDDPDALKPVWLALDCAERDEAERRRLETGPVPRQATIDRLRQYLHQTI
jgi:diadenosine tetraphosphate (Ap4A) HIT family hydrolase